MSTESLNQQTTGHECANAGVCILGGGDAVSGLQPSLLFGLAEPLPAVGAWPWPAGGLDPVATASGSLVGLAGCASMTFGLIANQLKAALPGSVWQAIGRRQLKRAFNGGGPPGADCGGLLGSLHVMGLVGAPLALQRAFREWYCEFAFPSTDWDHLYPIKNSVQTVSRSPLCHNSRDTWEAVFNREVYPVTGVYDTTRCSKVPRDCAKRAVELINDFKLRGCTGAWTPGAH